MWDLSENRLHHQPIDHLPCLLRSPSFNTSNEIDIRFKYENIYFHCFIIIIMCLALSADQGHRSTIVGLSTVIYSNDGATDGQLLNEVGITS